MRMFRRLAYWLRLSSHNADLLHEVEFHRGLVEADFRQPSSARPVTGR